MQTTRTAFASPKPATGSGEILNLQIPHSALATIPGATPDDPRVFVAFRGGTRVYANAAELAEEIGAGMQAADARRYAAAFSETFGRLGLAVIAGGAAAAIVAGGVHLLGVSAPW